MCGTVPPLPNTPSWHGAQLKTSIGTTLPLPLPCLEMGILIITGFPVHKGITSTIKRVKLCSGRMLYVIIVS
jgi:hypothetical protein